MLQMDTMWFITYATYELECDSPILEALGVYWRYVREQVAIIVSQPKSYQNFAMGLFITDPGVQLALIARNPTLLRYVPEASRTPQMCAAANDGLLISRQWSV